MSGDPAILEAVAAWVEAAERGPDESILCDLTIDRPCPLCGGSTFCPQGCPMAVSELDYEKAPHRRERPIREYEHRRTEDGGWEAVLTHGRECDACTIYGQCLSCFPGGREQRAARKEGGAYLVAGVPLYSTPGCDLTCDLTDPIKITAGQVRKQIDAARDPQLDLLGASSTPREAA